LTITPSPDDTLLFPIGHYMGAFHPSAGAKVRSHDLRIGDHPEQLEPTQEFPIWALCHGLPDQVDNQPWTRAVVERAATQAGIRKPDQVIDELLNRKVLVEVAPNVDAAVAFASAYRVQPLFLGLGNLPDDPTQYGIGLFGRPLAVVSSFAYDLWKWAHLADSLWHACQVFADVAAEDEEGQEETNPDRILAMFLQLLHPLLARNVIYLDQVV